jgi:hypothetical protein
MPKQKIKIIKISNENKFIDRPKAFPRLPRLYLELLENKTKIKQDLINKEYAIINKSKSPEKNKYKNLENRLDKIFNKKEEKSEEDIEEENKIENNEDNFIEESDEKEENEKEENEKEENEKEENEKEENEKEENEKNEKENKKRNKKNKKERIKKDREDKDYKNSNEDIVEETEYKEERDYKEYVEENEDHDVREDRDVKDDDKEDRDDDRDYREEIEYNDERKLNKKDKYRESKKYKNDSDNDSYKEEDRYSEDKYYEKEKKRRDSDSIKSVESIKDDDLSSVDNLSVRINELLEDDSKHSTVQSKYSRKYSKKDKYSIDSKYDTRSINTPYKKMPKIEEKNDKKIPPSLAELEAQGGYVPKKELRNIEQVPVNEQEEEDQKREIIFKFELLKKSYPSATIPEYTIHSDFREMKKTYETTVRKLSLESSVENYKTYLIGGFMACEFILGNFLKFDMQGFTQQQILSMNSYEKLLIELGEKSYVPSDKKWPVELRLLFMIIMNAAFFIISKMIMKKTGANLLGMINSMNVTQHQPVQPQGKKRRMKGPDIDLDNLPDQ